MVVLDRPQSLVYNKKEDEKGWQSYKKSWKGLYSYKKGWKSYLALKPGIVQFLDQPARKSGLEHCMQQYVYNHPAKRSKLNKIPWFKQIWAFAHNILTFFKLTNWRWWSVWRQICPVDIFQTFIFQQMIKMIKNHKFGQWKYFKFIFQQMIKIRTVLLFNDKCSATNWN